MKEKNISLKLSIDDYDFIVNYANSKKKNVSKILRDYIVELKMNKEEIQKEIDYYEYEISILKKKMEKMEVVEQKEKKEFENTKTKVEENKEIKETTDPIIKKIISDYQEWLYKKPEKRDEKTEKVINNYVENCLKQIKENSLREESRKKINHILNKNYGFELKVLPQTT